jgi:prepilin-type N-terminal cleavage/methylation domain-containing protein
VRARGDGGFSLVEVLMALAILGLAIAAIFGYFFAGTRAWQKGVERMDHQQNGRIAMDKIAAELRYASFVDVSPDGQELRYVLINDDTVYLFKRVGLDGDDLVLVQLDPYGSEVAHTKIALGITALLFSVDLNRNVQITLTAGSGPDSATLTTSFRPRNIP